MKKVQTVGVLQKIISLCHKYSIVIPDEGKVSCHGLTCYQYGAIGSLLRRNLEQQWWSAMLKENHIYSLGEGSYPSVKASDDKEEKQVPEKHAHQTFSKKFSMVSSFANFKVPFGILQEKNISSAVNNELKTDIFLFNASEQKHLCLDYYMPSKELSRTYDYWQLLRLRWWKHFSNLPSKFQLNSSVNGDSMKKEVFYEFPWGTECLETIQCTDVDSNDASFMTESGEVEHEVSHLQCITYFERGILAYLIDAYRERSINNIICPVLHLHPHLAAYNVAVLSTCSPKNHKFARDVSDHLAREMRQDGIQVLLPPISTHTDADYSRYDGMGIPWLVIIDDESLEYGIVHVRSRHTTLKEQMVINSVARKLIKYVQAS